MFCGSYVERKDIMLNRGKVMDENGTLKAKDFQDIELVKSGYYWYSGYNEHTLRCKVHGRTAELNYTVYRHDEGYGFTIHSDGTDIWETMPEPELEKLENVLSNAVAFGEWKKRLEDAKTREEVQEVRYSLYDEESGKLTGKQIQELHTAIDEKEAGLIKPAGKRRRHSR